MTKWTNGHRNLYLEQLFPSCALTFFIWENITFLSPVKMWILCYCCRLFKGKADTWVRRGGVSISHLTCMISPLRPPNPVWHWTPCTLSCTSMWNLYIKKHNTYYLFWVEVGFFSLFFYHLIVIFKHFLFLKVTFSGFFRVGCIYLFYLIIFCKESAIITVGQ